MGTIPHSYVRRDGRVRIFVVKRDDGLFGVRQEKLKSTGAGERWTTNYVGTFGFQDAAKADAKARADQPTSR